MSYDVRAPAKYLPSLVCLNVTCPPRCLPKVSGLNTAAWQDAIVDQICERMFVAMGAGDVQAAFDYFDVDGDGNIEYEEFINTLKALDIGLSDEQVRYTAVVVCASMHGFKYRLLLCHALCLKAHIATVVNVRAAVCAVRFSSLIRHRLIQGIMLHMRRAGSLFPRM